MRLCLGKAAVRAIAATFAVVAAAGLAAPAAQADGHFVLVSHAPDSDSWWNTIKNAIKQADEDFDVKTDYRNPPNGDIADMARLIEQSAARDYDGVITTIADYDVLKNSLGKVTAKKIPLVTINSGTEEQSAQLGAIMHVGQPEYFAGHAAGEKAKAAGVKSFLCVNHIATNSVSFDRSAASRTRSAPTTRPRRSIRARTRPRSSRRSARTCATTRTRRRSSRSARCRPRRR